MSYAPKKGVLFCYQDYGTTPLNAAQAYNLRRTQDFALPPWLLHLEIVDLMGYSNFKFNEMISK